MEDWDLHAFIFSQDNLNGNEKELCFKLLDGQGFSDATKRGAFLALNNADLQNVGITQLATRKALLLAIEASTGAGGAAAGLGVGGTAGAGAPAPRRLVDSAAKLHQLAGDVWELRYSDPDVPDETYVDAAGVLGDIRSWVVDAMADAVENNQAAPPSLLLVSGLVKTGKSHTQEHMVPAVVAEELRKQGEKGPLAGMVVLRLSGDDLDGQEGAMVILRSLLRVLLRWARAEHVRMREGALEAAENLLARPSFELDMPGRAIREFLEAVEVPVLVLFDEVQSLFLPTIRGKLDIDGAAYIRESFMKPLLVYGPRTILWCFTGSSMSQTWISLASMPPNGSTVVTSACAVNLPATYSSEHMDLVWKLLQDRVPRVQLDRKLLELCPPSIALLTVLVRTWIKAGRRKDVADFVCGFMKTKLITESLKEWKLGLEGMPLSQRIAVLDLSFPGVGAQIDTELHDGLQRFLEPHLDQTEDGRYYFRDSYQRQIVRLLFNKDGTLRKSWSNLEFSASLTQLDAGWNLLFLGEAADYLLGLHASCRWEGKEPPAGMDKFKAKMQAIAHEIGNKLPRKKGHAALGPEDDAALGPRELWEQQLWFSEVLKSKWNSRDYQKYKNNKEERCTHLDMLVFFLRLSRNVLAHTKPWDRENGDTLDVRVITVLPSVLGQSLFAFNEDMVKALRLVSRRTMVDATAEFGAQLSGSPGGSIEGLAEDEGSSSGGLTSAKDGGRRVGRRGSSRRGRPGSSGGGGGSSRGGVSGRGVRAMADECAPARPGPAAGCGQRTPLVYATGRHGVWGQGGPRAATLAPRLRVQRSLFAPPVAVGLWLPF